MIILYSVFQMRRRADTNPRRDADGQGGSSMTLLAKSQQREREREREREKERERMSLCDVDAIPTNMLNVQVLEADLRLQLTMSQAQENRAKQEVTQLRSRLEQLQAR